MAATGVIANRVKQSGKPEAEVIDEIVTEGKTLFGMGKLLDCQPNNLVYWLNKYGYKWDPDQHAWVKPVPASDQPQNAA